MTKFAALILTLLGAISISAASHALTPLSKEQVEAVKQEWLSAPIHVQAEVVSTLPVHNRDRVKCGRIKAVVRRVFKGKDLLPVGNSFSIDHCVLPDVTHTTFKIEFEPGRFLEAVLKPDVTTTKDGFVINIGLRLIEALSSEPQLPWMH